MYDIPVLFLVFNRIDTSMKVFARLKETKPKYLYIAADGPRKNILKEAQICNDLRNQILASINWECEVHTLFRKNNLGCKDAVSSAIDWFFQNVEYGIILEDDCLPNNSFFFFCKELLLRYKDDTRIMMITGDNFQNGLVRGGGGSYYFSKFSHVWGWATWKRAWEQYDADIRSYPAFKKMNIIDTIITNPVEKIFWLIIFGNIYNKKRNTWDHQLTYSIWRNNGLCIVPNCNLVSNIGFGRDTTHTGETSKLSNLPTTEIKTIVHPKFIVVDRKADAYTFAHLFLLTVNVKTLFILFKELVDKIKKR